MPDRLREMRARDPWFPTPFAFLAVSTFAAGAAVLRHIFGKDK